MLTLTADTQKLSNCILAIKIYNIMYNKKIKLIIISIITIIVVIH